MLPKVALVVLFLTVSFAVVIKDKEIPPGADLWSLTSVSATLENKTNRTLTLFGSCTLDHGIFEQSPPGVVKSNSSVSWKAESDGSGWTEGSCEYQIEDASGTATFSWDNPPIGSDSYSADAPESEGFSASYQGSTGYHSTVTYTLTYVGFDVVLAIN
eukprot:CAMPEP_0174250288 /NCGR_PEP_ID=MMETSP0439-20130205/504_1 /TAXON_ID=0 /ORGANISM="Stereomyxa ramosa, Strain Chinc5" /LENGTH=157 /DNA_ID=CAMNT_0015330313 /DNA_START=77 /DNA_END=550 /DNA_ORIENTATION=-